MNRIMMLLILIVAIGSTRAQSPIDDVFNKYAGQDGYTTVVINSFMFQFLSNIESDDPDYKSFKKATSGIESIRILTQEDANSQKFGRELLDILPREEYKELMVVKEANEEVVFLVKQAGENISEFLLVVTGESEDDALIVIKGDLDMETISSLSGGLDLPAMENLEELDNQ
ncbi:MAG TPA: DUF4252 domain-containing protein [Bacteroidales bacterium]|nr:DUF4252 domain-containing protein [Bacteroidales bacterium]